MRSSSDHLRAFRVERRAGRRASAAAGRRERGLGMIRFLRVETRRRVVFSFGETRRSWVRRGMASYSLALC